MGVSTGPDDGHVVLAVAVEVRDHGQVLRPVSGKSGIADLFEAAIPRIQIREPACLRCPLSHPR